MSANNISQTLINWYGKWLQYGIEHQRLTKELNNKKKAK